MCVYVHMVHVCDVEMHLHLCIVECMDTCPWVGVHPHMEANGENLAFPPHLIVSGLSLVWSSLTG